VEAVDLHASLPSFQAMIDALPQIIWTAPPEGGASFCNARFHEYTGLTFAEVQGAGWTNVIHVDDLPGCLASRHESLKLGEPWEYEYRLRRFDGEYRWFLARAEPVRDPYRGTIVNWVGTATDITERKRLEQEREVHLAEVRAQAEREALLNRIGAAVRSTSEPAGILRAAVTALGQGLNADRCYFVRYNQARDQGYISPEWLRSGLGLQPLAGLSRQMSLYSVNYDATFMAGRTQVVDDTIAFAPYNAAPLLALQVRSLLRIPMEVGDEKSALGVAMANAPRQWTEEEIRLAENVAALVRSALESAHVQQRERTIAQHLQEALVPHPPTYVSGLALASFYRSSLNEANVGGDAYDIFPLKEESRSVLCVFDLAGKGLAAASQVATVRNMLRFALYSHTVLSEAVTHVDQILVQQNLLTGFATLFVGIYDDSSRLLTYVNCGQEPGLLWRATTGKLELLDATGPVLGGFDGGAYQERAVRLEPGDVLALFTDGMTEIGPNRKTLLEVEGLQELFVQSCIQASEAAVAAGLPTPASESRHAAAAFASSVRDALIARVESYAGGAIGIRDDIALAIAVAAPE